MNLPSSNLADQQKPPSKIFDPEKGFVELSIVRWSLGAVLVTCAALIAVIAATENLEWLVTGKGLQTMGSHYRVPVAFFTLTLPFFALMAAAHRSEQTKNQMQLTRRQIERTDKQIGLVSDQNNFSNFYKHLEEFGKYCASDVTSSLKVTSYRKLHGLAFPRATLGELRVDPDAVQSLAESVDRFLDYMDVFGSQDGRIAAVRKITELETEVSNKFKVEYTTRSGSQYFDDGVAFFVPGNGLASFIVHQITLFSAIDEILKFDLTYQTPAVLHQLKTTPLNLDSNMAILPSPNFSLRGMLIEYARRASVTTD